MPQKPELQEQLKLLVNKVVVKYQKELLSSKTPMAYWKIYKKLHKEIRKSPITSNCIQIMKKDPDIKKHPHISGEGLGSAESEISTFVNLIYNNPTNRFEEMYIQFESWLDTKEKIAVEYSCDLYNFSSTQQEIKLSDNVFIRKTKQKKLKNEYERNMLTHNAKSAYQILYKTQLEKGEDIMYKIPTPVMEEIDKTLLSLSILETSNVFRDTQLILTFTSYPFSNITFMADQQTHAHSLKKVHLNTKKIRDLKKIFAKKHDKTLLRASSRLLEGASKRQPDAALIDFMIGLETLYTPETNSEISFKLALRSAYMLKDEKLTQLEFFKFIKNMYTTRSNIVHGSKYSIEKNHIQKIEEILRKSIKLYILNDSKFTKDNLDKLYLSNI